MAGLQIISLSFKFTEIVSLHRIWSQQCFSLGLPLVQVVWTWASGPNPSKIGELKLSWVHWNVIKDGYQIGEGTKEITATFSEEFFSCKNCMDFGWMFILLITSRWKSRWHFVSQTPGEMCHPFNIWSLYWLKWSLFTWRSSLQVFLALSHENCIGGFERNFQRCKWLMH